VVSLNYRLTPAEVAHQLDASVAKVLIYDEALAELALAAVALVSRHIHLIRAGGAGRAGVMHFDDAVATPTSAELLRERSALADDVAGIWFTSGTEGTPKGAVVRHRSAMAAAQISSTMVGINRDTRCLAVAPMFHRGAAENVALAVTMAAGTHYLQHRFDPVAVLQAMRDHRITLAFIVPTMARMMLNELETEEFALPALETWVSASSPLPVPLYEEIRRRFKTQANIVNIYGITEMLVITGCPTRAGEAYTGSAGKPCPMMEVRIHDDEKGVLGAGSAGEIIVRGPCGLSQYLNNPQASERAALMLDGVQWYRTGDIGMLDADGDLTILDRKKDMILSGGENIYCAEVEAALLAHPAVQEVAVVGRPDDQWGEIVVAFVVTAGEAPTLADLRSACAALASYKHPRELIIVSSFPRNSFGKIQKVELRRALPPLVPSTQDQG
jgi:acyl-CoA synthetase (AMP-forming)/AMP-acid ligase II